MAVYALEDGGEGGEGEAAQQEEEHSSHVAEVETWAVSLLIQHTSLIYKSLEQPILGTPAVRSSY